MEPSQSSGLIDCFADSLMLFDSFSFEYIIYRWYVCAGRALPTQVTNVTTRAGLIDDPIRSMLSEYISRILISFGFSVSI